MQSIIFEKIFFYEDLVITRCSHFCHIYNDCLVKSSNVTSDLFHLFFSSSLLFLSISSFAVVKIDHT